MTNASRHPISMNVSQPDLSDLERGYLLAAFDSTWISSRGPFIDKFETAFAEFAGTRHAMSCTNGTAALHLALLALGLEPGDEVIVPALTYVATANAVRYVGAEPVLADCDPQTWTLDPASVERLVTERTRAVIPVHLYGFPCAMQAIRKLARRYDLHVIEDAAEAHGAHYAGKPVGSLGDIATFSFYGNKIMTAGEGGMVCTDRDDLADRVRHYRGQGVHPSVEYWFDSIGYNYRMTNPASAIGLAQLERFDELRERRSRVRSWYDTTLSESDLPLRGQMPVPSSQPVLWMYGVTLHDELRKDRDTLRTSLDRAGIETRPFFHPLNALPMYRGCRSDDGCPVSRAVAAGGVMLPTHTGLTREDVQRVVHAVSAALRQPTGVV